MQLLKFISACLLLLSCVESNPLAYKGEPTNDVVGTTSISKVSRTLHITSQEDLDTWINGHTEFHVLYSVILNGSGPFDFKKIPVSYVGRNTKCRKSTVGSDPFIFVRNPNVTIKNLVIKKSSPDGIEISKGSNVKFVNLDIQHSCDEGITVRDRAKLELISSRIVSQHNKGVIFYSDTEASISKSTISSEQAFSLASNNRGLKILIENSIIKKHPLAEDGRLITGDNCGDVHIKIHQSSLLFMQQLIGTLDCKNIQIEYLEL